MEKNDHLEENTSRLMQAGLGGENKLNPKARKNLLALLQNDVHRRTVDFPLWVLGITAGVIIASIFLVIGRAGISMNYLMENPFWIGLALPAAANLILAPAASIVVVLKRRKHG